MANMRWLLIAALAGLPAGLGAQETERASTNVALGGANAPAAGMASRCAVTAQGARSFQVALARARALDDQAASEAALEALESEARRLAAEAPNDPVVQYHLAAVLGSQLDFESGTGKMNGAQEVHAQAQRVLALDPQHAGANYMVGKLHASIRRLSGVKRFMARTLYGGDLINNASWEEAEARLSTAVQHDPCVPEHHLEMARVHAQKGDAAGWERELAFVYELTAGKTGSDARLREKAQKLERDWRGD